MKKFSFALILCLVFASFALADVLATSDMAPAVGPVVDNQEYTYENPFDVIIWSTGAPMDTARYGGTTGFYNGQMFIACGRYSNAAPINLSSCDAYNPVTNAWTTKAQAPTAVRMAGMGRVQIGSKLYVCGGRNSSSVTVNTTMVYDMATDVWTAGANMPAALWAHGAAAAGGFVYIFGGSSYNVQAYKYDPATNAWTTIASLPVGRGWVSGASLGGMVYSIGGATSAGASADCYKYNPATNAWTSIASLPAGREYHTAVGDEILGKIYAFGGAVGTGSAPPESPSVAVYDAATNTWAAETDMPAIRCWVGACNNDLGTFYVVGGCTNTGSPVYYNQTWIGATSAPQLNVNVTMTAIGGPIVIPANGGQFQFNAGVINNGPAQATFWVWARIRYPDGSYTTPNVGPVQITPPVGVNVSRTRTQNVLNTWPAGTYYSIGYAGTAVAYPASDADSFSWVKSTTADGGPLVWDATCYGEAFPGEIIATPTTHTMLSNSPNPFNPSTTINFALNVAGTVNLTVYDVNGRQVSTLVNGYRNAGSHDVTFDGSNLASGVYVYTLTANGQTSTAKMVLMK